MSSQKITFPSIIDEKAEFEPVRIGTNGLLLFDFGSVTFMNSLGVRVLAEYFAKIPSSLDIEFHNCRGIIVRTFNMVEGILSSKAVVKSFFVPFECEKCDSEKEVLAIEGQDFGEGAPSLENLSPPKCDECEGEMELAVIPQTYFKFLNHSAR